MTDVRYATSTDSDFTRAINSVLLKLASLLADYRDSLIVSGGLAMYLLFGRHAAPGPVADRSNAESGFFARVTKDVDLVLNIVQLARNFDDQVESIGGLLTQNLYQQENRRQFWVKGIRLSGFASTITIPVEFLAPTPFDTGGDDSPLSKVTQQQEIRPAALDGVALALLQPRQIFLSGEAPDGGFLTEVPLQVVDPAMLILIKAIAFEDRLKKQERDSTDDKHLDQAAKHAYDISQLLFRYPGGVSALVERLVPPYITSVGPEQPTIDRALQSLDTHFGTVQAQGIRLMIREGEYREETSESNARAQQGTARRVKRLLASLYERQETLY